MKPFIFITTTLLLASMFTSAVAQRTHGVFQTNSTGFSYSAADFTGHVFLTLQIPTAPGNSSTPTLYVLAVDYVTGAAAYATGRIPWSAVKATGSSFTLNIADVRALAGLSFTLTYNDITDFSIQVAVTTMPDWQQKSTSNYTARTPQPNGTVQLEKDVTDTVETSMAIKGTVVGMLVPRNDMYGLVSEIFQSKVRAHTVQ